MQLRRALTGLALALLGAAAATAPSTAAARQPGVVDVDLAGVDVRDVLRLIADVGHVNVVYGDEVVGPITLRLRRVSWQKALDVVLGTKGLAAERDGNVIRVASPATFAKERAARIEAHAACVESAPLVTRLISVSYADPAELAREIQSRLSRRGTVTVDQRTSTLIVTDIVGCD